MPIPGITQIATTDLFGLAHIPKFSSDIWFVDAGIAASGDGTLPETAYKTIGEAIAGAGAGDAITVKAGTYTENIDMNLAGLDLWSELGVILIGTLTVSADGCQVQELTISPAGAIGMTLTGNRCVIDGVKIVGTPTTAYDINGYQNVLVDCIATGYTVTAFDIANYNTILSRCIAQGADTATRGFYFSNAAADDCTVRWCISIGNGIAGYAFVTGTANTTITRSSSGSGDGRWVDTDYANVWSDFTFDSLLHKVLTLDGTGTYNLFKVTGLVQINHIYGTVTTPTPANTTAASLQLFPTAGVAVQLTSLAGSNISSLPIGSMINKDLVAAQAITVSDSTLGFISEQAGLIFARFIVGQQVATETHIRLNVTEAGASGVIHWHADWEPLSDDGFLEVV